MDFFTAFLGFMSILTGSVPYFPLASGEFWTFSCFFCALCPFSPALFRISLWLPDDFGLFYCFSRLYVHFLLPGSVFPSGFRMFLDFFLLFLCFMSIFTGSAPYFSLASGCFWTFLLFFSTLCPFSPARLRISLWLPDVFGLFPAFSVLYVYFLLPGSVFPSGFRMFLDFFTAFLGLMSIFSCSVQCFSLVSRSFWTFFLAFLCFMSIFTCSVRYFPLASRSFWTFSLFFSLLCPYGRVQKSPD